MSSWKETAKRHFSEIQWKKERKVDPNNLLITPETARRFKAGGVASFWAYVIGARIYQAGNFLAETLNVGLSPTISAIASAVVVGVPSALQYSRWKKATEKLEREGEENIPGIFKFTRLEIQEKFSQFVSQNAERKRDQPRTPEPELPQVQQTETPAVELTKEQKHEKWREGLKLAKTEFRKGLFVAEIEDTSGLDEITLAGYNSGWASIHEHYVEMIADKLKSPDTLSEELIHNMKWVLTDQFRLWQEKNADSANEFINRDNNAELLLTDTPEIDYSDSTAITELVEIAKTRDQVEQEKTDPEQPELIISGSNIPGKGTAGLIVPGREVATESVEPITRQLILPE